MNQERDEPADRKPDHAKNGQPDPATGFPRVTRAPRKAEVHQANAALHQEYAERNLTLGNPASLEKPQHGRRELRPAGLLERCRRGALSAQPSAFLPNVSLGLDLSEPLEEMLQQVAELARELLSAECGVATLALQGRPRAAEAVAQPEPDTRWNKLVGWLDLFGIYELVRRHGGAIRMTGTQLARTPAFRIATIDQPLQGWLAASLTDADGCDIGAIQLFNKHDASFNTDDQAMLVYLAQMISAAIEPRIAVTQPRSTGSSFGGEVTRTHATATGPP